MDPGASWPGYRVRRQPYTIRLAPLDVSDRTAGSMEPPVAAIDVVEPVADAVGEPVEHALKLGRKIGAQAVRRCLQGAQPGADVAKALLELEPFRGEAGPLRSGGTGQPCLGDRDGLGDFPQLHLEAALVGELAHDRVLAAGERAFPCGLPASGVPHDGSLSARLTRRSLPCDATAQPLSNGAAPISPSARPTRCSRYRRSAAGS